MKTKRTRRVFNPEEKITAVLSIWTERKTLSQMCREMSVSNALVNRWQDQAMEAMLKALSPKRPTARELSPRLQRLIDKKLQGKNLVKLERRLKTIQRKAK